MKYKNFNIFLEDVSYCVPTKELFKQTYKSLFEFNRYKNEFEKTWMIRFHKWRLVISIDRLIELSKAGIYSQELDTEIRPTGTDTNITRLK